MKRILAILAVVLLVAGVWLWHARHPPQFNEYHFRFDGTDLATEVEITPAGDLHIVTFQGRIIDVPMRQE